MRERLSALSPNRSLKAAAFLWQALGLLMVILVFFALALRTVHENAERVADDRLVITAVAARNLDLIMQLSLDDLASAASHLVYDPEKGVTDAHRESLRSALEHMSMFSYRVSLVDRSGTISWSEPDPSIAGVSLAGRPFIQEALADPRPRVSNMLRSLSGQPIIVLVAPVIDSSSKVSGLLIGDIDLTAGAAADFLPPMEIGDTGYVQVVDSSGNVLMSSNPLDDDVPDYDRMGHLQSLVARGHPVTGTCYKCHEDSTGLDRERETMAFYPLLVAPWGVMVRQSEREAMADVWRLQQDFTWVGLAVLVASLGLLGFGIRRVFDPLESLTTAAEQIAQGNFDVEIPDANRNEVGVLAYSFEQMTIKVRGLLEKERMWRESLEIQVQDATRDLASLCKVSQTVNRTSLNLNELLHEVLGQVMEAIEPADASILFLYEIDKGLVPAACVGYDLAAVGQVRIKPGEGMTGQAFLQRDPVLCDSRESLAQSLRTLSRKNRVASGQGAALYPPAMSALALPLSHSGQIQGVLLVISHSQEHAFSPAHISLAKSVSDQIAVGLVNARLYRELQQREAARSDLLRKLISAQEEERRRVARELHDEAGQALTAVMMSAVRAEKALPPDMDEARSRLVEARARASQALDDVRRLVFDLRPQVLDDLGLLPALRWFVKTRVNAVSLESRLDIDGIEDRLPSQVEITVFRVVQEALTNVIRHSEASRVIVRLKRKDSTLYGLIADDGRGFESGEVLAAQSSQESWGLRGMEERVHLLGGAFSVRSDPGKGTKIRFQIPLETFEQSVFASEEVPETPE